MDFPTVTSKVSAENLSMEQLSHNKTLTDQEKIKGVSRQFEAILLRQFLTESQKPVFESKSSASMPSASKDIYRDMMVNTLADQISKSHKLGLSKFFEAQLTKSTKASHPAAASAAPSLSIKSEPGNGDEVVDQNP